MFWTTVHCFFWLVTYWQTWFELLRLKLYRIWSEGKWKLVQVSGRFELSRVWVTEGKITVNVRKLSRWNRFWFELVQGSSPGGVLPEKLGRGVRPASQNPYPIYAQNLQFSLPYLWPDQKFDTLFMTSSKIKAQMGKGRRDEKVASSKKNRIEDQSTKIDTLFVTKMAAKWLKSIPNLWPKRLKNHTLWGRTYLYSPYKGVPPPGGSSFRGVELSGVFLDCSLQFARCPTQTAFFFSTFWAFLFQTFMSHTPIAIHNPNAPRYYR